MQAIILAGGKGTRLRPLTVYTPKPIVPVVNRPFLFYQLEGLGKASITNVTLSLSYQPNKIEEVFSNGVGNGVDLKFVTEPNALGTAGAIRFAIGTTNEPTLVLNGDILTDADLSRVVERHKKTGAALTIALARVDDPSNYGLVGFDSDGRVSSFIEKPSSGKPADPSLNTINAGIYVLEPDVLSLIPQNENCSFEYNVFPAVLEKKMPFFAYVLENEYWRDIGTPQTYLAANLDILSGLVNFAPIGSDDNIETSPTAFIDSSTVIGEGCIVKPNARISNSVLGPGVHVEEKAVIENSVIWPHCRISTFSEIRNSIVGRGCHIGRNSILRSGVVLGDKAVVPDYSII